MFINNFDPVAFQIFSFEIRWYSLAYIIGILLGWFLSKKFFISDLKVKEKFEDYIKTKPQFYKLLNKMFCTRFYNYNISEYIFQYTEELFNYHNNYHYNNYNNYYNNYQTNYQMIWN